ncbi:lectizyme-like [Eupeodes corollae]|uniref:lectizyme-like n=1 Tax=Eupeodes corollae TaxID=290404 RepID=UPI0024938DC2|nr:lectizyme-like [Eupeodes corollae]XP_055916121.1 lectizyme-like [Eupeodes corollae]XP_055916128.1 lectizyme-like [Eupeodes corollae]XP_055916131.1 lectizyme-like [Eupeodes corollae]
MEGRSIILFVVIIILIVVFIFFNSSIPGDKNYNEHNFHNNLNLNQFIFPNKLPCHVPCAQNVNKINNHYNYQQFEPKTVAEPNSAPFVAAFLLGKDHVFDGVIISKEIILTAGHNLTKDFSLRLKDIKIAVGLNNILHLDDSRVQIRKIHKYTTLDDEDLALVYLDTHITYNDFVTEVALPKEDFCKPGTEVKSYTFGPCSENFMKSTELHCVTLKIQTPETCVAEYGPKYKLCANDKYKFNGKNCTFYCQGDSGSPLIMVVNDRPTLVGVLLGGNKGCSQDSVIFFNVFFIKEWLLETPDKFLNSNQFMEMKTEVGKLAKYAM